MFKRVVTYPKFWKSVVVLSLVYGIIMYVIQWGLEGNWSGLFTSKMSTIFVFFLGSFIVGFAITYGKFWRKLKEEEFRNKR